MDWNCTPPLGLGIGAGGNTWNPLTEFLVRIQFEVPVDYSQAGDIIYKAWKYLEPYFAGKVYLSSDAPPWLAPAQYGVINIVKTTQWANLPGLQVKGVSLSPPGWTQRSDNPWRERAAWVEYGPDNDWTAWRIAHEFLHAGCLIPDDTEWGNMATSSGGPNFRSLRQQQVTAGNNNLVLCVNNNR